MQNHMMRITTISLILILLSCLSFGQNTTTLFKDDHVKVSFKVFDDKYAYLLEDYEGMFGGKVVEYKIVENDFIISNLDTVIIIDSMVFYGRSNYTKDSVMLSLRFRINEFADASMWYTHLKYIINDSLEFQGSQMVKNDEYHRVLIPQLEEPYKLEVRTGLDNIGPFIIDSENDVSIKIVVMKPSLTFQFDYGKNLPNKITFKGKTYNLIHDFEPWN